MANVREPQLEVLARAYGVQTTHYDDKGRRRRARPDAVIEILKSLGAPIETMADVPDALWDRSQASWSRVIEPVAVVLADQLGAVDIRLPRHLTQYSLHLDLVPEIGEPLAWSVNASQLPVLEVSEVENVTYEKRQVALPKPLAAGYHHLKIEADGDTTQCLIISAPSTAYEPGHQPRSWGAFLPLYALRTQRSAGVADFSDLQSLGRWTAKHGGSTVGTLPLLATFLDEPIDPSPYAPVSRLFWNELYVDIERAAADSQCQAAQDLMQSPVFMGKATALRTSELVPYAEQFRLKRELIESLAGCLDSTQTNSAFHAYVEAKPELESYAAFRATTERQNQPWRQWPQRLRDGLLVADDYDEAAKRYHLYAQWLADSQLGAAGDSFRAQGLRLYLDFPLGVNSDGYDTWRYGDLFAKNVSAGAPPDDLFTNGQNWNFLPLQPQALREDGYSYLISCLRNHLAHADILRIDHIMGLHRLFWIGQGFDAKDGVYVGYPAEELYAILRVESHRHRATIFGEDLGTVPRDVRQTMKRYAVGGSHVVELEAKKAARVLRQPPRQAVASLNTHDLPTFAAYWRDLDIDDRINLGHLSQQKGDSDKTARKLLKKALKDFLETRDLLDSRDGDSERAVLEALLLHLASSPANLLLINLEDLWLEEDPQNVPGTTIQRPNWRRKARFELEDLDNLPGLVELLEVVERARTSNDARQR